MQILKPQKIFFDKLIKIESLIVDLTQAQFFKTSLRDIDLSNSLIDGIAISLEDIKGATISELQAVDLISLIGVKIKV